jgi:hypothetical protein
MLHEYNGQFFVWTKGGHAPRKAHQTRAQALSEAERLAALNPGKKFIVQQFLDKISVEQCPNSDMVSENAEKEPAMQKTIWYGTHGQNTRFFGNEPKGLNDVQNVGSFTVNGEVSGLNIETAPEQQVGASQSQQATG